MRKLVVARHAESELKPQASSTATRRVGVGLTDPGAEQARALGAAVGAGRPRAHTEFERTRETAELAWPGTPRSSSPS